MNPYKTFVFMFHAIDAIYEEEPNEILHEYLSDLNPFIWKGEASADPAEYECFKESFLAHFSGRVPQTAERYAFCKTYLQEHAPKEALKAFLQVPYKEWAEAYESEDE